MPFLLLFPKTNSYSVFKTQLQYALLCGAFPSLSCKGWVTVGRPYSPVLPLASGEGRNWALPCLGEGAGLGLVPGLGC